MVLPSRHFAAEAAIELAGEPMSEITEPTCHIGKRNWLLLALPGLASHPLGYAALPGSTTSPSVLHLHFFSVFYEILPVDLSHNALIV
jgi:hypothetical protein